MSKKILKYIFVFSFLFIFCFSLYSAASVSAQTAALDKLKNVGETNGPYATIIDPDTEIATMIGIVISAFFGLLGVIFISLTIYAGYNYMTAQGEDEKVNKALATLRQAIIGLIITIGSYAIWNLVSKYLIGNGK